MKTLEFHYHLQIAFSEPVSSHRFTVRGFPVSDQRQKILTSSHSILPNEFLSEYQDSFGNRCVYGNAKNNHDLFDVQVDGIARTGLSACTAASPGYKVGIFKQPTSYTKMDEKLMQFYQSLSLKDSMSNLEKGSRIMEAVYQTMKYQPASTGIQTTAGEAFSLGHGVCQDYAHIMLALCRYAKIPCRYVVGMLIGEGASHAWVEIYDRSRWFGLDPTNFLEVREDHVKMACGRDYGDCILNRGVFIGNASQVQTVEVRVEESKG